MRPVKCPKCFCPLELYRRTSVADFYRCVTCGKQTEVKVVKKAEEKDDSVGNSAEST